MTMKIIFYFRFVFLFNFCFSENYPEKALAYDFNGNIAKYIAPHAGEISYTYDPIQRLIGILYPDGTTVKYTYDYNSNLISVSDKQGITVYVYDALNRLIKAQLPTNICISYEYDYANRLTKIIYPDREEVKYNYDHRNRLTQVSDLSGNTQYEYDDITNLVVKERLANGITTSYTYDSVPRVTGVDHRTADGRLIIEYQFTYDKNSNCILTKSSTLSNTQVTRYIYDQLNRVVEIHYSDDRFEKYYYDGAGNRLERITHNEITHYEYDQYNRLIKAGETHFFYDASGNLSKKTSKGQDTFFGYDSNGKLVSYKHGKKQVSFAYDGEGRRISKTVNGKTTSFINDPVAPLSRVLLEQDEHGQTKTRYVYGCSRLSGTSSTGCHFFLYDHPGKSVGFLVDANQRVLNNYSYSAFGIRTSNDNVNNPYGYAGEEYDEDTGLIYLRNRYYDPELGRFISPDCILGILGDPQTLNAYVYVRNNPVNFIDPSGFYAEKVPLTFYGNFPGARTPGGKSRAGHGWMGGRDITGQAFDQGSWFGNIIKTNESQISLCKETVSLTVWVDPEKQILARQAGNYPRWTPFDNCIDHVVKSLDAIGYPHPSFKPSPIGISDPVIFCNWIIEENKHIDSRFVLGPNDIVPYESHSHQAGFQNHSLLFQPNYGGISLSKTAELMTDLSDIAGAVFDQNTGQFILYGERDLALPSMPIDDLAVAVRSIYGLGGAPAQDPGISMDPVSVTKKKNHPQMAVTYYGDTKNTRFGQVLFEADRLLKDLTIGKDSSTGKKIKSRVHGYRDLLTLYRLEKNGPDFSRANVFSRMWFVPEKICLTQSEDGTSMVFDEVRMRVLTESKFKNKPCDDPASEKFAVHFTHNYEKFAQEFPILQDLKRLGKLTGIVKWIQEQGFPVDLSFFQNYSPQCVSTPTLIPKIFNAEGGVVIIGGVLYHLDDSNFSKTTDPRAHDVKNTVLSMRPKEEDLTWDCGNGYTAVAQSFGKSLKIGNVQQTFVDMSFPVLGTLPFALVRTYDSFNEERSGFGVGWDVTPATLRFVDKKRHLRFADGSVLPIHPNIFLRIAGTEVLYKIAGLDGEKRPIYHADGNAFFLLENSDGTFAFSTFKAHLLFDPAGKLIKMQGKAGMSIDYAYDGPQLIAISQQGENVIHLEYQEEKIVRALGIGGKAINYLYTPNGQLKEVCDSEGTILRYSYDKENHLTTIFDAKGNRVFEANYDIYHRAINKTIQGTGFKQDFSLSERRAKIEGSNKFFLEQHFNEHYRPQKIVDALGRQLDLTYTGAAGPSQTIDNNGVEIIYEYDQAGHPTRIKDAYRGERMFVFDAHGNCLLESDGMETLTSYCYDKQDRLTKIYHPPFMRGKASCTTTFHYDEVTGGLVAIEYPGEIKESFLLNENGLPIEICYGNGITAKRTYDTRSRLVEVSEAGNVLHYSYDGRDRLTKIASSLGAIFYSYDQNNNVVSKTDLLGCTSFFEYDEQDHLIRVIDPLGGVSTYEYNAFGHLTYIHLPNGSIRELRYDEFQRPVGLL